MQGENISSACDPYPLSTLISTVWIMVQCGWGVGNGLEVLELGCSPAIYMEQGCAYKAHTTVHMTHKLHDLQKQLVAA